LRVDLLNVQQKTIRAMRLSSSVLTPNGDGINDEIAIEYDLFNLVGGQPVEVEVFDLSGRSLVSIASGGAASGRFTTAWNGLDRNGSTLSPGLYILRLKVDTDGGAAYSERVVSVVY
jgi:flagellar hook assembly protein FlgD